MNSLFNLMLIVLLLIFALSIAFGTNLKRWYGWAQVLAGFLLGLLIGLSQNLIGTIVTGILFGLLVLLLGPVVWKRRHS